MTQIKIEKILKYSFITALSTTFLFGFGLIIMPRGSCFPGPCDMDIDIYWEIVEVHGLYVQAKIGYLFIIIFRIPAILAWCVTGISFIWALRPNNN